MLVLRLALCLVLLISGESGGLTRDVLMALSWLINVVVAEAMIAARRPRLSAWRFSA